ncbi:ribonuclease H-like protein [Suillus occidentalis]|nr:ribonuclease H-like protein [Suillus occidentalis]
MSNEENQEEQITTVFDPTFPSPESLEAGFRAFVIPRPPHSTSAHQAPKPPGDPPQLVNITIAGTHLVDKDGDYMSGGGAWLGKEDSRNLSIKIPSHLATPGAGEIAAFLAIASSLPNNAPLNVMVKSNKLRKDLTTNLPRLEDTDWMDHPDRVLMTVLVSQLRTRSALTTLMGWKAPMPKTNADEAMTLATTGMNKPTHDSVKTTIDPSLELTGLKLNIGTQRLFYKSIKKIQTTPKSRRLTLMNMAMTQYAVCNMNRTTPTNEQIWSSIRNCETPINIRGFLWKCLHGAYKIGEFWDKIPNCENRGKCSLCDLPESMEHILLDCNQSSASRVIWEAAADLWKKREANWPQIRFGTILGCNLAVLKDIKGKKKLGATRLFKILVLESAHLIWKLRCERVIKFGGDKEKYHSDPEILNRWIHAINMRLKFDRLLTDSKRYGKKAIKIDTVLKTWSSLLKDEDNLPDNWIHQKGVLVGMTSRRPPGRTR